MAINIISNNNAIVIICLWSLWLYFKFFNISFFNKSWITNIYIQLIYNPYIQPKNTYPREWTPKNTLDNPVKITLHNKNKIKKIFRIINSVGYEWSDTSIYYLLFISEFVILQ